MSNVITVDFSKRNVIGRQVNPSIGDGLTAYLDSLRESGLDEDDVLDTLDAINDMKLYFDADPEVQSFADGWLEQFL